MEGPTDEDAFRSVMKKLHARQQVVFLVIHGDITADRDVNARNALTAVNQKIKELMRENGALNAMMSGSGPTVFGLFDELETAKMAAAIVRQSGLARQVFVTDIYNNRR